MAIGGPSIKGNPVPVGGAVKRQISNKIADEKRKKEAIYKNTNDKWYRDRIAAQRKLDRELAEKRAKEAAAAEAAQTAADEEAAAAEAAVDPSQANYGWGATMDVKDPRLKGVTIDTPSKAGQAKADPMAIAAQQRVLNELLGIYDQGGASAQDRAFANQARLDTDQYLRSQRQASEQDMAERGMLGSGAEIAALLGRQQEAGSRMSKSDLDMQAMHEKRAMDALMGAGDVSNQVRTASFKEAYDTGMADDEFTLTNNEIINGDVDFKREFFKKLADQKHTTSEGDKNRAVQIAGLRSDMKGEENDATSDSATKIAGQDVDVVNDRGNKVIDTTKDISGPTTGSGFEREVDAAESNVGRAEDKTEDDASDW